MTDPQAYLASLPDVARAEAERHLAEGKSHLALDKLRRFDSSPYTRTASKAVEVLADRMGVDLQCHQCSTAPAKHRDDYPWAPLCDECSSETTAWICPDCDELHAGERDKAGRPCWLCEAKRIWAACPPGVKAEVARWRAADHHISAIKVLMEHIGGDRRLYLARVVYEAVIGRSE